MPTGQSEHRSELQFRIGIADTIQNVWDPSNDYSFKDLVQGGEDAMIETPYITMYDGDKLIWGTEPNGKTPDDISKLKGVTAMTKRLSGTRSTKRLNFTANATVRIR